MGNREKEREAGGERAALPLPPNSLSFSRISPTPPSAPDTQALTKTAENHTLWGTAYLYSPYKGVPPFNDKLLALSRNMKFVDWKPEK